MPKPYKRPFINNPPHPQKRSFQAVTRTINIKKKPQMKNFRININKTSKAKEGYVYFIIEEPFSNCVKIGKANNVDTRIRNLQTGNVNKLRVYKYIWSAKPFAVETMLHNKYRDKHLRGEWFNISLRDVDRIVAAHTETKKISRFNSFYNSYPSRALCSIVSYTFSPIIAITGTVGKIIKKGISMQRKVSSVINKFSSLRRKNSRSYRPKRLH